MTLVHSCLGDIIGNDNIRDNIKYVQLELAAFVNLAAVDPDNSVKAYAARKVFVLELGSIQLHYKLRTAYGIGASALGVVQHLIGQLHAFQQA